MVGVASTIDARKGLRLKLDERDTRRRIEFLPQVGWALRQDQFASRANASFQKVSPVGRAVAFAHHRVGMNLMLTVFQGNVANQR